MISFKAMLGTPWQGMKPKAARAIKDAAKYAAETAVREYVLQRQPQRFKPSAFSVYKFERRQPGYERRQRRYGMSPTPYVSPRGSLERAMATIKKFNDAQKAGSVGGSLIAAAAAAAETIRNHGRPHMRELVKQQYTISARMSGGYVGVMLKQAGARILNRSASRTNGIYIHQFKQLARGGDLRWLAARTKTHFESKMKSMNITGPARR